MSTPTLILVVGVVYMAATALIGAAATRRTRSADDFFVAGRRIGLVALALSTMSASLSGFAFIGGPGLVYALGLGAVFIVLPAGITNPVAAWVLGRRLRALAQVRPVLSLPDAIRLRFESPLAQGLAAVAILLAVIGYLAANLLAMGVALDVIFDSGVVAGVVIGTLLVLGYSVAGGIVAGIWTDLLQGGWMAIASLLVFVTVLEVGGGFSGLSATLLAADPEFLAPWGRMTPLAAVGFYLVYSVGVLGQPHVMHKFLMLHDARRLRWFPALATLALVLMILLFVGVGIAVRALEVQGAVAPLGHPDDATPTFLLGHAPGLLAALVFSGVAAAIMSTVNSFLSVGAAAVVRDLPRAFGRPLPDELRAGRVATAVICLAAAGTALFSDTLLAFLAIFGWGLFASTLVPVLAIGLNWPRATRAGAVASIATGLGGTIVLEGAALAGAWTLPTGVSIAALTLLVSTLVFIVVSVMTTGGEVRDLPDGVRRALG